MKKWAKFLNFIQGVYFVGDRCLIISVISALSRHAIKKPMDVYLSAVGTWRLTCYDNIKTDFLEIAWGSRDWIDLV
jgi:hypothetical protein